ncbi:MAG: Ppx/GppA phosphatase family protein [Alphaproteobacteria bacterium]
MREIPDFGPSGRFAVVDIGSNSVRMVVFEGIARALVPLFNEKALCGLGRGLGATGKLNEQGVDHALSTLRRFNAMAKRLGVAEVFAIATAAVREAQNGGQFVREAKKALKAPIRVIEGEEEATFAALGVAASMRNTHGIVGDLGGGSLELARLDGIGIDQCVSMPLGPFRLMDQAAAGSVKLDDIIDNVLKASLKTFSDGKHDNAPKNLYAVGGAWRTIGRIHMAEADYPLRILHQYAVPTSEMKELCGRLKGMSLDDIAALPDVPTRRVDTLPYGAHVLERLLELEEFEAFILSAHGVREGAVYHHLNDDELALDPLLSNCRAMALQYGRLEHMGQGGDVLRFPDEMFLWSRPLFASEHPYHMRRRHAACILSDIAWRSPSDYRGEQAFAEIMRSALVGVRHEARGQISLSVLYRYTGSATSFEAIRVRDALPEETRERARLVGLVMRLGISLSGGTAGVLPKCPLKLDGDKLILSVPARLQPLASEVVETRLSKVADQLNVDYDIRRKK